MTTVMVGAGGLLGVLARSQAALEVDAGEPRRATLYVAASVIGGLAAAVLGYALGRRVI